MDGMARSKLDMSLDDIIKLQKKQRNSTPKTGSPQVRRGRGRGRARVLAARPRIQKVMAKKQSALTLPGRLRASAVRGRRTGQNVKTTSAMSSSAALAVLRRARQTAVDAAKAAAQAAELIRQTQARRQNVFDANRGLQSGAASARYGNAFPNTQPGLSPRMPRTNTNVGSNMGDTRLESRRLRRVRRRQRRAVAAREAREAAFSRSVGVRNLQNNQSDRYDRFSGDSSNIHPNFNRRRPRRAPRNYPSDLSYFGDSYDNHVQEAYAESQQAREREYLAQARALIRAQTEQARGLYDTTASFAGAAPQRMQQRPRRPRRGLGQGYQSRYGNTRR